MSMKLLHFGKSLKLDTTDPVEFWIYDKNDEPMFSVSLKTTEDGEGTTMTVHPMNMDGSMVDPVEVTAK